MRCRCAAAKGVCVRGDVSPRPFLFWAHSRNIWSPRTGSFAPSVRLVILKYTKYSCDPDPSPVTKLLAPESTIHFASTPCYGFEDFSQPIFGNPFGICFVGYIH
jgi:hypothetical protein